MISSSAPYVYYGVCLQGLYLVITPPNIQPFEEGCEKASINLGGLSLECYGITFFSFLNSYVNFSKIQACFIVFMLCFNFILGLTFFLFAIFCFCFFVLNYHTLPYITIPKNKEKS